MSKKALSRRINFLFAIFLIGCGLVVFKLFTIQILQHQKYTIAAERQHWDESTIPAARGEIYTADDTTLVSNRTVYLIYAEPPNIKNAHLIAENIIDYFIKDGECLVINSNLSEDLDEFQTKTQCQQVLEQRMQFKRQWVPLMHKLAPEDKQAIEKMEIDGLGFEEESERYYPEGRLAAHILGFVGSDFTGGEKGYYGLEGYYDGNLRGTPGRILEEQDALGRPIPVGEYKRIPPRNGADLKLTLDRSLQFMLERHLEEGVKKYGAENGTAVMLKPQTGAVLVLANFPTYNPGESLSAERIKTIVEQEEVEDGNADSSSDTDEEQDRYGKNRRNFAIASTYEPGSVLKSLSMSAVIDSGTVTPQTTFQCDGPMQIGGYTIRTWDNKYHGTESMIQVLQHSCNVGAAWAGQQLGAEQLREYYLNYGLGSLTKIDLEGEDTGRVKDLSEWRDIDTATTSFGQGISMTPLQLITSFSAIVNKGVLMQPYIVTEIHDGDSVLTFGSKKLRRVLDEESANIMVEMLTAAAEKGEAKFFVIENYHVAGKTGTAQIPVEGRYDPSKTNSTFIGFLPNYPEFVLLVKLEKPSTSVYAAETAVPLWMSMVEDIIAYYGFPPDK